MTIKLITVRERVEQMLADTGNDIWDRTWLDEAIRHAMYDYSQVNPVRSISTVTAGEDTYELDISSVSGMLGVVEVWAPFTAANPEHPPNSRIYEHWVDSEVLFFPGYQIASGDVVRVFYTSLQTLNGLDGASVTTIPTIDEILLLVGAAAHVATSRAIDLTEKVSVGQATAQQVRAWGLSKLQEFKAGLNAVGRRQALRNSAFVKLPELDRWDGEWA